MNEQLVLLPGPASARVDVDRSECRMSGGVSIALSIRVRPGYGSMIAYEGLLRVLI